jgi:hypothetical protein
LRLCEKEFLLAKPQSSQRRRQVNFSQLLFETIPGHSALRLFRKNADWPAPLLTFAATVRNYPAERKLCPWRSGDFSKS